MVLTEYDMKKGLEQMISAADAEITRLAESRAGMVKALNELDLGRIQPFGTDGRPAGSVMATVPRELTHSEQVASAIEEVLREEQPLHRDDILTRVVEKKSVPISTKNPLETISQSLSRNKDRFVNVEKGKGIWALVGYVPESSDEPGHLKVVK